ncbi:uncharacterized protein BKA78DRAFT_61675 [Phyllosticta capitalensis]|uniref:Uncharacterized protein n=1 Tax=Phyllosticta capitalensis TaxID=121624 RepID=A0ABR1YBD0_9PEZI
MGLQTPTLAVNRRLVVMQQLHLISAFAPLLLLTLRSLQSPPSTTLPLNSSQPSNTSPPTLPPPRFLPVITSKRDKGTRAPPNNSC